MRDYKEIVETYDGQIYDDLWLFPRRGEGGDPAFHGAFIPQVPQYLAIRYTSPGDVVWDPMAGSGTTGDALKDFPQSRGGHGHGMAYGDDRLRGGFDARLVVCRSGV